MIPMYFWRKIGQNRVRFLVVVRPLVMITGFYLPVNPPSRNMKNVAAGQLERLISGIFIYWCPGATMPTYA